MKTEETIKENLSMYKRLKAQGIENLEAVIKVLEWVLSDEDK